MNPAKVRTRIGFDNVLDHVRSGALEARKGRKVADEQFHQIDTQLSKLRRAAAHAKTLALGTCLAIEELTNEVAAAVAKKRKQKKRTKKQACKPKP